MLTKHSRIFKCVQCALHFSPYPDTHVTTVLSFQGFLKSTSSSLCSTYSSLMSTLPLVVILSTSGSHPPYLW